MLGTGIPLLSLLAYAGLTSARVDIDPGLIPALPAELPIYALGSPLFIPDDWLSGIMGSGAHREANHTVAQRRSNGDPRVFYYNGDQVVGYVNKETGETRVFPDYAGLQAFDGPADIQSALGHIQHGTGHFPVDDTCTEVVEGSSLRGVDDTEGPVTEGSGTPREGSGTISKRTNDTDTDTQDTPDSTYLTLGVVHRYIDVGGTKYPVCGPGSQAVFGVGAGNRILSLSYYWKPARKDPGKVCSALSAGDVAGRIREILERKYCKEGKGVKVYAVDACFYDSGAQYMQPVYRVTSQTYGQSTNGTEAGKGFVEYIPVGSELLEPTDQPEVAYYGGDSQEAPQKPELEGEKGGSSTDAPVARSVLNYFDARQDRRWTKPTVKVGIYVVRNDIWEFVVDAWNFWLGLRSSPLTNFVLKQYLYAWPRMFGWQANSYVNSVDLALVEAHGNFHAFTTDDSRIDKDYVRIPSDIMAGGLGKLSNGGKGCLSYWIIDAGEVMPTRPDFKAIGVPWFQRKRRTFDPWWPVFDGGVHAIMTWRTAALMSDNVAKHWAQDVAWLNTPVVNAWMHWASVDPAYTTTPPPVYTGRGTKVPNWPLGRAAVMFRCGRAGDRVTNLEKLGKPKCLAVRYWDN